MNDETLCATKAGTTDRSSADGSPALLSTLTTPRWLNVLVSLAVVAVTLIYAPLTLIGLAIAAVIAMSLEELWPLRARQRPLRAWVTDLVHAVGNRYLILGVMAMILALARPAIQAITPQSVGEAMLLLPVWGQVIVVLLLTDLFGYFGHRALHEVPVLWRFHRIHHCSERVDWLATSRVHPLDLGFVFAMNAIPFIALGYDNLPEWVLAVLYLYPFFLHTNARLRLGPLELIAVSPVFHHWHHADNPQAYNKNYAALFTFWDRLFRTIYLPGKFPDRYGIGDPELDTASYTVHLLEPLTRRGSQENPAVMVDSEGKKSVYQ